MSWAVFSTHTHTNNGSNVHICLTHTYTYGCTHEMLYASRKWFTLHNLHILLWPWSAMNAFSCDGMTTMERIGKIDSQVWSSSIRCVCVCYCCTIRARLVQCAVCVPVVNNSISSFSTPKLIEFIQPQKRACQWSSIHSTFDGWWL